MSPAGNAPGTLCAGQKIHRGDLWGNAHVAYLGWNPRDSSERFRAGLDATQTPPPADHPAVKYQGGSFAAAGHFEDGPETDA